MCMRMTHAHAQKSQPCHVCDVSTYTYVRTTEMAEAAVETEREATEDREEDTDETGNYPSTSEISSSGLFRVICHVTVQL